jgi:hypothetical protein
MPPKRRVQDVVTASAKRQKSTPRGTLSQPITIKSPLLSPRISPRKALVEASQALDFEARLRDTQAEEAIIPPIEGSEQATITTTNELNTRSFDEYLEDNFEGIDWDRIPLYMKPMATQRSKKSWVYRYGYRVALRKDPTRIYFVCRYCHKHKFIDAGVSQIYETTRSTSATQRHLREKRRGHNHQAPDGETRSKGLNNALQLVLTGNRVS